MLTGGRVKLNKRIYHQEAEGTITVFLSLILILILSLLCTIIEGARVSTAKVNAERAMTMAMDSVLAEYYGPLWEEYHIFGYYSGGGSETEQREKMASLVSDYMSYTFVPNQNLADNLKEDKAELYDIKPYSISVDNETDLMDYDGKLLINEAVEYMKYRETGDLLEKLLDKLSLLESPGKVSYVMEEKQKVEEELVEIDKEILKLMKLYDGLMTSEKGIELAKDGSLVTTSAFIKKICYEDISRDSVGINQESIFLAQKANYVNPTTEFAVINNNFTSIEQILSLIESIQTEIDATGIEIAAQQVNLEALNVKEDKTEEDKRQIKEIKGFIKALKSNIEGLENQILAQKELMELSVSSIEASSNTITQLIDEIKPLINTAITSVNNIIVKLETAAPLLEQYEELLTSQKEVLSENIYKGLEEELKELKKYTAAGTNGYDFTGMRTILENNRAILTNTQRALKLADKELAIEAYLSAMTSFENAEEILKAYQINGLTLDYSTLVYDKTKQKTPLDEANSLISSGFTSLVLDPNSISDSEILTSELLPSEIHSLTQENEDFGALLTSFFENAIIGGKNFGMGDLFGGFSDSTKMKDSLGEGVNALAELLLYQEYLADHFGRYQPQGEETDTGKPSILEYEQEYLLVGKTSDQENLASVISRIVFLRMIFDFVSVLSDSSIRNEAKLAATALVGFTGLPILVSLTQVLILLIWSFTEALLDTCALMMGKEMPILKKNVVLKLPEIFLINRDFLQNKASSLTDTKEVSLSYQDYLRVFLLMKGKEDLAYRSMDLMQENIRLRYDRNSFTIEDCLFGFETSANFMIGSKFTAFSFLPKSLNNKGKGYRFSLTAAYSY